MAETLAVAENGLVVARAQASDRAGVLDLYARVTAAQEGDAQGPAWVAGLHPCDKDLDAAIAAGTLFVGLLDGEFACAAVLDGVQPCGYENVPWQVPASPEEVAVVHLMCVSPGMRGRHVGSTFMQQLACLQRSFGKRVVRLDALQQNTASLRLFTSLGYNNLGVHIMHYPDPRVTRFEMFELALRRNESHQPAE